MSAVGHAVALAGSMTWEILWALILGFGGIAMPRMMGGSPDAPGWCWRSAPRVPHRCRILAKLCLPETGDDHRRVLAVITLLEAR